MKQQVNLHVRMISGFQIIASKGHKIYLSEDQGKNWHFMSALPITLKGRAKTFFKLSRRLFRSDIHHILPASDDGLIVFGFHHIWTFDRHNKQWGASPVPICGSRPLLICRNEKQIVYGEYFSNPRRGKVHLWQSFDDGKNWQIAHSLSGVRHIHGVFWDQISRHFWITTGDDDEECGIWRATPDFSKVEKIVGGDQQARAVQLLFTEDYIYYGTDTPLEQNYIYRIKRNGTERERLVPVPSSVFYGTKANGQMFFATVCEPSMINETKFVALFGSDTNGGNWIEIARYPKDIWHMKLFQYGQLMFPYSNSKHNMLWCTPVATKYDQKSFQLELK